MANFKINELLQATATGSPVMDTSNQALPGALETLGKLGVDYYQERLLGPARDEARQIREDFLSGQERAALGIDSLTQEMFDIDRQVGQEYVQSNEDLSAFGGSAGALTVDSAAKVAALRPVRSEMARYKKAAIQRAGQLDAEFYSRAAVAMRGHIARQPGLAPQLRQIFNEEIGFDPGRQEIASELDKYTKAREAEEFTRKKMMELVMKTPYAYDVLTGSMSMTDPKVREYIMEDTARERRMDELAFAIQVQGATDSQNRDAATELFDAASNTVFSSIREKLSEVIPTWANPETWAGLSAEQIAGVVGSITTLFFEQKALLTQSPHSRLVDSTYRTSKLAELDAMQKTIIDAIQRKDYHSVVTRMGTTMSTEGKMALMGDPVFGPLLLLADAGGEALRGTDVIKSLVASTMGGKQSIAGQAQLLHHSLMATLNGGRPPANMGYTHMLQLGNGLTTPAGGEVMKQADFQRIYGKLLTVSQHIDTYNTDTSKYAQKGRRAIYDMVTSGQAFKLLQAAPPEHKKKISDLLESYFSAADHHIMDLIKDAGNKYKDDMEELTTKGWQDSIKPVISEAGTIRLTTTVAGAQKLVGQLNDTVMVPMSNLITARSLVTGNKPSEELSKLMTILSTGETPLSLKGVWRALTNSANLDDPRLQSAEPALPGEETTPAPTANPTTSPAITPRSTRPRLDTESLREKARENIKRETGAVEEEFTKVDGRWVLKTAVEE